MPYVITIGISCVLLDAAITRFIALRSDVLGSTRIHRLVSGPGVDVVPVLGSSRANVDYIADSLHAHAFNFGNAGAGYDAVEFQLRKALEHEGNMPIIVNVDLGWWSMHGVGDPAMYIPSMSDADVRQLLGDQAEFHHRIPLIRYFGVYQNYASAYLTEWSRDFTEAEGYSPSPEEFEQRIDALRSWKVDHEPDSARRARLFELVDRHPDRRLIFVVAPYHPSYFTVAAHEPGDDAWLTELGRRAHVTVVDFSHHPYPDSFFVDPVHMNRAGARRFSSDLRAQIQHLLPPDETPSG